MTSRRRLEGKVILLTGAAGGVGRETLRQFASEGARVIATDLVDAGTELMEIASREGSPAAYVSADLATDEGRSAVLARCAEETALNAVCCSHGIIVGRGFLETTPDDWNRVQRVNLESVYFLIQGAVPLMPAGSSIVITTSTAGLRAQPNMSAYSAAKGALVMLARSLALDLSSYGIRVNAIAPGLIDTPMPRGFIASFDDPEAVWKRLVATNMFGRAGQPEEVASVAVYLVGDESSFTTGSIIPVDGGRLAM